MHLIWHGTASVEVVCREGRILFDPFVPLKGSSVPVKAEDFDGFSDIFITHGHLDHIVSVPEIINRNSQAKVYCTEAPRNTLMKKGVPQHNLRLIRYGEEVRAAGFRVLPLHGRHAVLPKASSARLRYILMSPHRSNIPSIIREVIRCREMDETVFYQIEADGKQVSLMGSMNLRDEVDYPVNADLLVLPYNGWEDNFPPAVSVIRRLKPKRVVLNHYDDTFPPLTMPLDLAPLLTKYEGLVTPLELGKAVTV